MRTRTALSEKWQFLADPDDKGLRRGYDRMPLPEPEDVLIPHSWNVGNGTDEYRGIGWYQYSLHAAEEDIGRSFRLTFDGVYRDAALWLNGVPVGKHDGSGFTTFTVDVTKAVRAGANLLSVRVDNRYSPYALPFFDQFDWADDGGIFRPVYLTVTDRNAIDYTMIEAQPVLAEHTGRVDEGPAELSFRVKMLEGAATEAEVSFELLDEGKVIASGSAADGTAAQIAHVRYWHFDAPELYTIRLITKVGGRETDRVEKRIGFRSFVTEGPDFVLNGEKVHLVGTEWMPGSDPRIGNAERPEDIARFLQILKNTNCVFTRVHWQQDDSFYDWCDAHGMMVQEEIPLWGSPKEPVSDTMEKAKAQFQEMLRSHYEHPSIVTWGVGNELDGQSGVTKRYVAEAVAYCRSFDPNRPVSYVSNTPWITPDDANTRSDIPMCNEYIGTWHQGMDNEEKVAEFRECNAGKPMFISEFGLCEPAFPGGDTRRERIFLEKIDIYRRHDVTGFIYFCLNDYRTQMGEDGRGRYRQRIHGSADCFGNPKPSYRAVTRECAPLRVCSLSESDGKIRLELEARGDLPRYAVKGYYAMQTAVGAAPSVVAIPNLLPGERTVISLVPAPGRGRRIRICRPNGDVVLELPDAGQARE